MPRQSIETIRRGELIDAALAVVARDGHDAATTQRIAARAEMSPGLVHHYFGDKAALLAAAMRAVRKPVAASYRGRLAAAGVGDGRGRTALDSCLAAHFDPEILTVPRAAAWLQFDSRVAYVPEYARIRAAVRGRQVTALRRALAGCVGGRADPAVLALRAAVAIDGYWREAATRPGGLAPGEGVAGVAAILSDSVW